MKLNVKYYGQLIDLVNKEEETININGKTINCLNTKILKLYPILNGFTFSIAQNNELKSNNCYIKEGKIDIFPPFSGG
tara:strand:- start:5812 stop:6045 length:234 start_codon:yes stop_codon:yes gene_type:complete